MIDHNQTKKIFESWLKVLNEQSSRSPLEQAFYEDANRYKKFELDVIKIYDMIMDRERIKKEKNLNQEQFLLVYLRKQFNDLMLGYRYNKLMSWQDELEAEDDETISKAREDFLKLLKDPNFKRKFDIVKKQHEFIRELLRIKRRKTAPSDGTGGGMYGGMISPLGGQVQAIKDTIDIIDTEFLINFLKVLFIPEDEIDVVLLFLELAIPYAGYRRFVKATNAAAEAAKVARLAKRTSRSARYLKGSKSFNKAARKSRRAYKAQARRWKLFRQSALAKSLSKGHLKNILRLNVIIAGLAASITIFSEANEWLRKETGIERPSVKKAREKYEQEAKTRAKTRLKKEREKQAAEHKKFVKELKVYIKFLMDNPAARQDASVEDQFNDEIDRLLDEYMQ